MSDETLARVGRERTHGRRAATPARHLRRVNLIERQRDHSESEAVSSARAPTMGRAYPLLIAAVDPPSIQALLLSPRFRRAPGLAGADDPGLTGKHESGLGPLCALPLVSMRARGWVCG
jgi:hypothetical protein